MNCENCNNQIGDDVKFCGKCGFKIEAEQEEKLTIDEIKMLSLSLNKEGLKEIVSRAPFVPRVPINRKEFFIGLIIVALASFIVGFAARTIFGRSILVTLIVTTVFSYVSATWWAKRFLDIKPKIHIKFTQIALFMLLFGLNILNYFSTVMLAEMNENVRLQTDIIRDAGFFDNLNNDVNVTLTEETRIALRDVPDVSRTTMLYAKPVSIARTVIGIFLVIFMSILVFKKGHKVKNMELRKS